MADAMSIAKHLVFIGYDPDMPEESVRLCPMRLQKMLYYAQGWSLALLRRPLFFQPIQAWKHGPVVREVYHAFQGKSNGIDLEEIGMPDRDLPDVENRLLRLVWEEYIRYTPGQLRARTHQEKPWLEARGNLPDDAYSDAVISQETMARFFTDEARRLSLQNRFPDPIASWDADQQVDRGQTISADELFNELLT